MLKRVSVGVGSAARRLCSSVEAAERPAKEVLDFPSTEGYSAAVYAERNPGYEEGIPDWFREEVRDDVELERLPELDQLDRKAAEERKAQWAEDDWMVEARIQEEWAQVNVSQLSETHRMVQAGQAPPVRWGVELEARWLRARLGRWGLDSGVNPGLAWPTRRELAEAEETERALEVSLEESSALAEAEVAEEAALLAERTDEVRRKLRLYPKVLEEYEGRMGAVREEAADAEAERQEKILAIQEHFGYSVEPSDPRFLQMMARKEEDERRALKQRRKAERDAHTIAAIHKEIQDL